MYCPNCGNQNGNDAKFCVSCGYSFANTTINQQNEYNSYHEPLQCKNEFIKDLEKKDGGYTAARVFQTIFGIACAVCLIVCIVKYKSYDIIGATSLFGWIAFFWIAWIIAGIILICKNSKFKKTYEQYVAYKSKNKNQPQNINTPAGSNEWTCPKCGRINQNYVGTCGCGEVKPK